MKKLMTYLIIITLTGLLVCDCARKNTLVDRFVHMASDAVRDSSSVSSARLNSLLYEYENVYDTLPLDDLDRIDEAVELCRKYLPSDSILYNYKGIEYAWPKPTKEQIELWRNQNKSFCEEWLASPDTLISDVKIPEAMINEHPCLAYLIIHSLSIADPKDKQAWFGTYSIMNDDQIEALYDILYRESYALGKIEYKQMINTKNSEAYEAANSGDFFEAFSLIDEAISAFPDNANFYDSKGEFYLMQGRNRKALAMWNKIQELDPDFLSRYNGHTNLYDGLVKLDLIK